MRPTEKSDVTCVWKTRASCGCDVSAALRARRARQLARTDQLLRSRGTKRDAPLTSNGIGSHDGKMSGRVPRDAWRFRACVTWPRACSMTNAVRRGVIGIGAVEAETHGCC